MIQNDEERSFLVNIIEWKLGEKLHHDLNQYGIRRQAIDRRIQSITLEQITGTIMDFSGKDFIRKMVEKRMGIEFE